MRIICGTLLLWTPKQPLAAAAQREMTQARQLRNQPTCLSRALKLISRVHCGTMQYGKLCAAGYDTGSVQRIKECMQHWRVLHQLYRELLELAQVFHARYSAEHGPGVVWEGVQVKLAEACEAR